jgi:hypothetical protein
LVAAFLVASFVEVASSLAVAVIGTPSELLAFEAITFLVVTSFLAIVASFLAVVASLMYT